MAVFFVFINFVFVIDVENIKDIPGIYCIDSILDTRIYIGSSEEVRTRLMNHGYALRGGYHRNEHLQNAFNLYGERNFRCYILEYVSVEEMVPLEQKYMDMLLYAQEYITTNGKDDRFLKLGFNLNPTAESFRGRLRTEEEKDKSRELALSFWQDEEYRNKQLSIRKSKEYSNKLSKVYSDPELLDICRQNGLKSSGHKVTSKSVVLFDRITGDKVGEYESISEAERIFNISEGQGHKVLAGKIRFTKNMVFKYADENLPDRIDPISFYVKNK